MRYVVQAHPRAAQQRVELLKDGTLAVWVRAPAVDGRANDALVAALAARLGLRPRDVQLVRGDRSRHKIVELPLDAATVRRRLASPEP
jgi:uncharacterized protein